MTGVPWSAWLTDVRKYGYLALLLGVMLENAGIPVPGETIVLVAGGLAGRAELSIWMVVLIAGSSEMSWPRFLLFNMLGAMAWSSATAALGYYGVELGRDFYPCCGRFTSVYTR